MSKKKTDIFKFGLKLFLFLLPFLLLIISFVNIDPFKVVRNYDQYNGALVGLNADVVSTEMYLKNKSKYHYNSFIFGNSRCLAYKVSEWKKYLGPNDIPFVYLAFNESLYGLVSKIKFIDAQNDTIKNALFIIDETLLTQTRNYTDFHLYVKHPKVSGGSSLQFYNAFFKAYLSDFFFIKCIDYSIFHKKRKYMNGALDNEGLYFDPVDNDLYPMSKISARTIDSVKFYDGFRAKFIRQSYSAYNKKSVYDPQENMLKQIMEILSKHKTHFKIIISPKIDRLKLHPEDKTKLIEIFGQENIYDFSGDNKYTQDIHNYYDPFHYTIETGNSILKEAYLSQQK